MLHLLAPPFDSQELVVVVVVVVVVFNALLGAFAHGDEKFGF